MSKHHCGKVSFISAVGGYLVREGVFDNSMAKFASWVSKDSETLARWFMRFVLMVERSLRNGDPWGMEIPAEWRSLQLEFSFSSKVKLVVNRWAWKLVLLKVVRDPVKIQCSAGRFQLATLWAGTSPASDHQPAPAHWRNFSKDLYLTPYLPWPDSYNGWERLGAKVAK